MSCIELRDVSWAPKGVPILNHLSMQVEDGEFIAIIGANGCGKTSTLRCIYGAVTPGSGQIMLHGRDLRDIAPKERARQIAVMMQDTSSDWAFSAEQVVELGRIPHKSMFRLLRQRIVASSTTH